MGTSLLQPDLCCLEGCLTPPLGACLWPWLQRLSSLLPLKPSTCTNNGARGQPASGQVSPLPARLKGPLSWAWKWPCPACLTLLHAPTSELLKPPQPPPPGFSPLASSSPASSPEPPSPQRVCPLGTFSDTRKPPETGHQGLLLPAPGIHWGGGCI